MTIYAPKEVIDQLKKMMFIFNPKSGKSKIKNELFYITDCFVKSGWSVLVHPTQAANDAYEQIKTEGKRYDLIVASGGDGTLRESINGLMTITEEKRPKLGYIPSGTVNDFAQALGIPKSVKKAVAKILSGSPTKCDIGQGNGNYFTYVAGFGAFTEVSYETPQNVKNILGKVAYFLMGIKSLTNIKSIPMKIKWDGGEIEDEFILGLITNVDHAAGMKIKFNENTEISDGLFEVILIKKPKSIVDMPAIVKELLSTKLKNEAFVKFSSTNFTFESEIPVKWTFDGEFGGKNEKVDIQVIQNAVEIIL